jgi:dTDP-4-amino-4,6-dideoxygalactose transaminase
MTDWKIPLSDLTFDEHEINAVVEILQSGWLTMGSVTRRFETEFAEWNRVPYAVALSSCTAALHLACIALGLGAGDEVILPALTFVATANAVRYTGATPVFAEINSEEDLTISPSSIRSKISGRTKAIIVMHYAGYPCRMSEIQEIADEFNLHIIEDAAHAVGSELNGQFLGTIGDIGCFSFFSNKNLVTGEGGMLVTRRAEISERVNRLRSHGMTTLTWDRHQGHASSYDVIDLGYNYRLDEIRSALGLSQLEKLEHNNQLRRSITEHYQKSLQEKCPSIGVPFSNHPGTTSAHIMPIILPDDLDRNGVIEHLKKNKIQTSIHYPPIHRFKSYLSLNQQGVSLPLTEHIASRELTLPLYPHLGIDQVDEVVACLAEAIC